MMKLSEFLSTAEAKTVGCAIVHYFIAILFYVLLVKMGIFKVYPPQASLLNMDAYWYSQIRSFGYLYISNSMCNMAYFPLFPFLWKATALSPIGISIFNSLLFTVSMAFLIGNKKYNFLQKLVILSFPSFIFFIIPYSEALFFFSGTILLTGYRRNSKMLICIGLLMCGLTRSVSVFFIPIIIITELWNYIFSDRIKSGYKFLKDVALYIFCSALGFIYVCLLQFSITGKWFYFITVQKYWNRQFQIPQLPFTTTSPERILGVDAIALTIGMLAFFILLRLKSLVNLKGRDVIFSILYILGILFLDVFLTNNVDGRTSIWSINRHIMCTPFFVVFLGFMNFDVKLSSFEKYVLFLIIAAGAVMTALYEFPINLNYYLLFFIVLFCIPLYQVFRDNRKLQFSCLLFFYAANVFLFVMFYQSHVLNLWVG